jgi:hypothetical protein
MSNQFNFLHKFIENILSLHKNILFTPSLLLFVFCSQQIVANQRLQISYEYYQHFTAFSIFFIFINSFIYTFFCIDKLVKIKNQGVNLAMNLLAYSIIIYFNYQSLISLGSSSYPEESVKFFALSIATFTIQIFLNHTPKIFTFMMSGSIIFGGFWLILFLKLVDYVGRIFTASSAIRIYQLMTGGMLIHQLILFFLICRLCTSLLSNTVD